jgi:hypothetical protein
MFAFFARSASGATASGSITGSAPTMWSEGDVGLLGSKNKNQDMQVQGIKSTETISVAFCSIHVKLSACDACNEQLNLLSM